MLQPFGIFLFLISLFHHWVIPIPPCRFSVGVLQSQVTPAAMRRHCIGLAVDRLCTGRERLIHTALLFTMMQAAFASQQWRLKVRDYKQIHTCQHTRRVTQPFCRRSSLFGTHCEQSLVVPKGGLEVRDGRKNAGHMFLLKGLNGVILCWLLYCLLTWILKDYTKLLFSQTADHVLTEKNCVAFWSIELVPFCQSKREREKCRGVRRTTNKKKGNSKLIFVISAALLTRKS